MPDGRYRLEDLTADAVALIDHLELADLVVIGVSLGGMMAQGVAAARRAVVTQLILSNTGLQMGTSQMREDRIDAVRTAGMHAIADAVLDRWFADAFRKCPPVERHPEYRGKARLTRLQTSSALNE